MRIRQGLARPPFTETSLSDWRSSLPPMHVGARYEEVLLDTDSPRLAPRRDETAIRTAHTYSAFDRSMRACPVIPRTAQARCFGTRHRDIQLDALGMSVDALGTMREASTTIIDEPRMETSTVTARMSWQAETRNGFDMGVQGNES